MREAIVRAEEEQKAVRPQRQGLRQHSTKNKSVQEAGPREARSSLDAPKVEKKAAPEQREAYSSAHAVRDLNSAAARRIKTTSRVYHLAGIGKCRNSLKTRCAALRLQLKIVFPSRSSACCFTCVRCEVIALPRNRMIYILVSLDALKRHSSPPKICGETSKVAHVCVVYAVNPVTSCGADTIDAARRAAQ